MSLMRATSTGQPRFQDPALVELARANESLTAWRCLFDGPDLAAALARVDGDFAVGLERADGSSVIAVDRFAIRTLCYRIVDGGLRWHERADALADADTPLDPQALFGYLFLHAIASPRTIFAGVYRLPPGHWAECREGRVTVRSYWVPEFRAIAQPDFLALRQRFRDALAQAVSRQLDGSKPAAFLSGGTDSSTVAGMIGQVGGAPAATFSIGFEAEGYDEMAYARIAARHFGTEHHEYYVTPDDLIRAIPALAAHHDQPFGNSSALPAYYCGLIAREAGVSRMLAGDGGDELFGGNSRYAKQRIFGWYGRIPSPLRRSLIEPFFGLGAVGRVPGLRKGSSYIEQARVPLPDRLQMHNLLLHLGVAEVLTPDFLAAVDFQGPVNEQREFYARARGGAEIDRMLAFDWRYTLAESDIPKVRGSTELAGVTVGYPMLDHALLELALELPPDYKLKGLKLRWFFKEALRGFLPDEILVKKKQGFGLPFGVWANRHAGLKTIAADSLRSLSTRGIVQPAFIDALLATRLAEHPGYYGEMVWILMMLEQWLRQHRPNYRFG